ncbi:CU044_2847 family protein [Amycolatopsis sp. A133]|uniref:CU044_2847 family protein n=1 Tax=Amycolatopsis sp. A133 TaxID=3064472 RepID=UPI0027FDF04C|nr:CU044_2847 family protein [Amycolatopsis sp. A133]MDQ7802732.1 CU044_2847 family protein [Amycolatopsis sp. A133]
MADTMLVQAETPGGETVVVPVVDLDAIGEGGGEQKVAAGLPSLSGALDSIKDFTGELRKALKAMQPEKTTVEFSVGFAMEAGKITAMFADGKAEGSVKITMEWAKD